MVISSANFAVSRHVIIDVTEKLFFKHSCERDDSVRIRGETWVATFALVLSSLSIRHKQGSLGSSTTTTSDDLISIKMVDFCLTSDKAYSGPQVFLRVKYLFFWFYWPVFSRQTIIDRKDGISTHCQLLCQFDSISFVSTFKTTSMNKHDGWSFVSLVTIRGQVSIKH